MSVLSSAFRKIAWLIVIWTASSPGYGQILTPIWTHPKDKVSSIIEPTNLEISSRINLIIMGDGYQRSETEKFLQDAVNLQKNLLSTSPFKDYRDYFNIILVPVYSNQSGASHPTIPDNPDCDRMAKKQVDNFFGSTFDGPPENFHLSRSPHRLTYSNPDKIKQVLQKTGLAALRNKTSIILINETEHGGGAGEFVTTTVAPASAEIFIHEIGHQPFNLGDEYWNNIQRTAANKTRSIANPPWKNWLTEPNINVFPHKNATGKVTGWYKPSDGRCRMESVDSKKSFCAVCREEIILGIHKATNLINWTNQKDENVQASNFPITFQAHINQTYPNTIASYWILNKDTIARQNRQIELTEDLLVPGENTLQLFVADKTKALRLKGRNPFLKLTTTDSLNWKIEYKKNAASTLFLFDLSGSMNDYGGGTVPKLEQAKQASQSSLRALSNNSQGVQNQVAVYGFAGGCMPDPTREFSPFDTNLLAVEQRILQMQAGGGTPLGNAIRAAECKMAAHLQRTGQSKGKLILLSDGQGTCGAIRPAGVYNSAPLQHRAPMVIDANQCGLPPGQPVAVSYYAVGFNIPPGSPAERDLQYLSQSSQGKYLNVQNQTQLTRAFRKFNRLYQPKRNPATTSLGQSEQTAFKEGVNVILEERFPKALTEWEALAQAHPNDCHILYNLALAQEANDLYQEAITNYRQYLNLCPAPADAAFVNAQITFLEEEFRQFVAFQRKVVLSDLAYIELHFRRIQNGQSIRLAEEFRGFLQEKGDYYQRLPRLLSSNDRFLANLTQDIASALERCAKMIKKSPENWDRDATPVISMLYLNLSDLKKEL